MFLIIRDTGGGDDDDGHHHTGIRSSSSSSYLSLSSIFLNLLIIFSCINIGIGGNGDDLTSSVIVSPTPISSPSSVPKSSSSSSSLLPKNSSLSLSSSLFHNIKRRRSWSWNRDGSSPSSSSSSTTESFKWNPRSRRNATNSRRTNSGVVIVPSSALFWHRTSGATSASATPTIRRRLRRLTHQVSSSQSSFTSSSSSSSSSHSASSSVASPANRLKILMNPAGPPGLVVGLMPPPVPVDSKCNFEIYRSGCFDENGSICDNDGRCVCRPGYSIRTGNIYCLRPSFIGEACYTTEQCERKVPHSGCFNYREEYREENPSAFFGPSQSQWPMGECRCRVGHRFDERANVCTRSIIGSWCSNLWDCEMAANAAINADDTGHIHINSDGHRSNRSHGGHHTTGVTGGGGGHQQQQSSQRSKLANLICENNTCQCGQFFHYNQTVEECQYEETYGKKCSSPIITGSSTERPPPGKRNIQRFRFRENHITGGTNGIHGRSLAKRAGQSPWIRSGDDECNYPSVCVANKTCACADGYEYQPRMIPVCQRPLPGGLGGAHYTHYYHSGSSGVIRSMKDAAGIAGAGYEGTSNVANFFEYVLYFLVPGLIIIFIFKPCFRRIGEWRSHIHQYQSDSDFYLAGTTANGRPVIAEMSVLGQSASSATPGTATSSVSAQCPGPGMVPGTEKPPIGVTDMCPGADFGNAFAFAPHLVCHNAYLFHDAGDPCYATPLGAYGCHATQPIASGHHQHQQQQQQQQAMALVREKLQTIEESEQSEDGTTGISTTNGCPMIPPCCSTMERCSCEQQPLPPPPPPTESTESEPKTTTTTTDIIEPAAIEDKHGGVD